MTPADAKAAVLAKYPDATRVAIGKSKFQIWGDSAGQRPFRELSGWTTTEDEAWQDAAAKWICDSLPMWRDRPTVPGWYVNISEDTHYIKSQTFQYWTAEDIARGCPFYCKRVYGPVPVDPQSKVTNEEG